MLVTDGSISHNVAVQMLYNIASESHHQHHDTDKGDTQSILVFSSSLCLASLSNSQQSVLKYPSYD